MKNVLLIGDSIRESYQDDVRKLLEGKANVLTPHENCRYSKFVLWGMHAWMEALGNPKIHVIHWNAGIWDLHRVTADGLPFTPLEEYAFYTRRLYDQMNSYTDKLIFATTTPNSPKHQMRVDWSPAILGGASGMDPLTWERWNANVALYNEVATAILTDKGNVVINDLYSLVMPRLNEYISDDGIHPTPEGARALARQVADHILPLL